MAADMHIHVFENITKRDIQNFFSNVLGSKYFSLFSNPEKPWDAISKTPDIWIGEVSWLKAMITGEGEVFIPGPVQKISDLIGEDLPVLDTILIERILNALDIENATDYSIASRDDVEKFLIEHKGKSVFTISW